ncbi:MAG: hypothetical protein Q9169_000673 [Polycauliona sp. 2 TL-2023]
MKQQWPCQRIGCGSVLGGSRLVWGGGQRLRAAPASKNTHSTHDGHDRGPRLAYSSEQFTRPTPQLQRDVPGCRFKLTGGVSFLMVMNICKAEAYRRNAKHALQLLVGTGHSTDSQFLAASVKVAPAPGLEVGGSVMERLESLCSRHVTSAPGFYNDAITPDFSFAPSMFSVHTSLIVFLSTLLSFGQCSPSPLQEYHRGFAQDDLIHSPAVNRQLKAARAESQIGKREISQALRVSAISDKSPASLEVVLSVSRVPWKKAIQTIRVDFAKSEENYSIPRQRVIGKRQASSSSEAVVVAATATTSSTIAIAFPAPPTTTPTATSAHQDLSFSYVDTPILPPAFPGVDSITFNAPIPNPGISFECKNCTVTGTIDILQGSVSGNTTTSGPDDDADDGFTWDSGSFMFVMNGFSAHMELGATIEPTLELVTYNAPMPSIGLPGFQIPGVGVIGPIFTPGIAIGTEISTQLEFTYGFDLTIPDNSSITLDLVNSEDSTVTGFPDAKIEALPFTSRVNNIALTVSAAFRPELLLGAEVLTSTIGAGIFFNLPTVAATISQIAHVNSKCEPIPANMTSSTVNDIIEDVFEGLTHIEPSVEFDVGVLAQAQLAKNLGAEAIYTIFNTGFPLPTACLEFNSEDMALAAVTPKIDGKAIDAGPGEGGAGNGRGNPLEVVMRMDGRLDVLVGGLLAVAVWFMSL